MQLTILEILAACRGQVIGGDINRDTQITSICTDSRDIQPGGLFIPLLGEKVDGHDYIGRALEEGGVCALTEKPGISQNPLIYVRSTRRALMDIAAYYRRKHNIKVVAITGSAGKTTTKDMIASVLSAKFKTQKTMKNFNNDIGLPLSIFQLTPEDEVLVLEMGMNHGGEIHELSLVGAPDIAVITNIGDAHIENFDSQEGILHAKLEILDGLSPLGTIIFNGNDPLLTGSIARSKAAHFKLLYPNSSNIKSMDDKSIDGGQSHFVINDMDIHINIPLPGAHMVMNALLAASVGIEMGLSPYEITRGFEAFSPPEGRLGRLKVKGMTIINDVYNSNPAATQESIKVIISQEGRKVCILGDMNELGWAAETRHKEIGAFAAEAGVDVLVTIGKLAGWMNDGFYNTIRTRQAEIGRVGNQPLLDENAERLFDIPTRRATGYRSSGHSRVPEIGAILRRNIGQEENSPQIALHFEDVESFLSEWRNILRSGDMVLIKASRGMKFETIIESLEG